MTGWRDHITAGIGWRERPGDGPVAVLLHGIGSRAFGWERLGEYLPGWRLIAWDAPGYGASAPLAQDWPVAQDYAEALLRLLDALSLPRLHLVGHSLGTLMGAAFAAAHPERLATLTLAACAQGGGIEPGETLAPAHQARIDGLTAEGPADFAAARAPRLIHESANNPVLVAEVTRAMSTVSLPGYAQATRMLASGDLKADTARVHVPTAVIVGADDIVTPPPQSQAAHAALPRPGPFVTVPGCGHALPLQAPAALAHLILAQAAACVTPCTNEGASR